ncbi:MAG: hypothetical protein HY917_02085 [Candidatus Diapherotrites archaeon]|nr:hypothetical protein [Candidatus Diapherotrites archaeon]
MAVSMRIDDEVRLNVLEALLSVGAVVPNLEQIQRVTGYHKATIKASLEFLKQKGVLSGFGPKVNLKAFDYNLEVKGLLSVDFSKKEVFDRFLERVSNDPHFYQVSAMIGPGNWNLSFSAIYRDVESFHETFSKNYYESVPGLFDLIRDRQVFYSTEPFYKRTSRTDSIIRVVRRERGFS